MTPVAFAPLTAHLWQSTLFAAMAGLLPLRCGATKRTYDIGSGWQLRTSSCCLFRG